MWNSCAKLRRLEAAIRLRGMDPDRLSIRESSRVLAVRGITDREQNPIVWTLITVLEPPACPMTHCKHYGNTTSPMNCAAGRTPGRCPDLRAYKKRKAERQEAAEQAAAQSHPESVAAQ